MRTVRNVRSLSQGVNRIRLSPEAHKQDKQKIALCMAYPKGAPKPPGSGIKKGQKTKKTIEQKIAFEELRQRVLSHQDELINAQLKLATGETYLFKIEETGKGKDKKREHVVVTNPEEIKQYLDALEEHTEGELEGYYYIKTMGADNRAIESLLNRVHGKPTETLRTPDMGESLFSLLKGAEALKKSGKVKL